MKKIWIIGIVLILNVSLHAQTTPAKVTRQATKALVEQPSVRAGTLSRYNGARGAVMGVDYHLQPAISQPATAQRSWLEQQKRNWKAHQLHKQRRARDLEQQIQAQEQAAREAILATLPQANPGHQFITHDFATLLADQIPQEQLPLVAGPGMLYRGLALPADGQAVTNILQNGLRVADVGTEANTRNLAYSGGQPGAVRALAKTPVTNLTSFPMNAAEWATKRITPAKPLLAVVAVNGQTEVGKVVLAAQDIPAGQITHFFVPLQVNGTPVWCNVQLGTDGAFVITPYDIPPAAH